MSSAETGQMAAVETGQMSASATGQMSAVETRQMLKSQIVRLALNHQKCFEMDPEWSPGLENRPPGMPRPFSRLWDRSRGPKPRKNGPKPEIGLSGRRLSGSTPQVPN